MNEKNEARPLVTDFLEEFKDALFHQLVSDHARWGDTWLQRPKEGQELRTLARYTDYFDMFKHTGESINWLAVVGGALICWIRENHPELCIDANEAEDEGKHNPSVPWSGCQACRDECLVGIKVSPDGVEDIRVEKPKAPENQTYAYDNRAGERVPYECAIWIWSRKGKNIQVERLEQKKQLKI